MSSSDPLSSDASLADLDPSSAEWLSAYIDAEAQLDADSLPASLATADGLARWDAYHLIGDVLRTPDLAQPVSAGFHARFLDALEQEAPIIAAPRRAPQRRFMTRYGLPGLAAAAAVASVTWMAQPYFGSQPTAPGTAEFTASSFIPGQGMVSQVSSPVAPSTSPSNGSLLPADAASAASGDLSLADYLDAHRQVSGKSAIREVSTTSYDTEAGQR
ncbi:membrane protein [Pigmentiphaga litoralis]|uniref:sigma-E factor negative regulatory protein n=1 Tax=Pigmentiphaga litoralis TaxID=516702 RepID=UPI0019A30478|nr:RseA family anti-sigma factor [Pigmentiphaga litoralis]GGX00604.1 membrane protein [Pigmentiphaga litoralis]